MSQKAQINHWHVCQEVGETPTPRHEFHPLNQVRHSVWFPCQEKFVYKLVTKCCCGKAAGRRNADRNKRKHMERK